MSKWKSSVFPGKALEERSQTRLMSSQERSLCGDEGCTKLADRETTSFKIFSASPQWTVYSQHRYVQFTHTCRKKPTQPHVQEETTTNVFLRGLMQVYFWRQVFWQLAHSRKLKENGFSMRISRGLACGRKADCLQFGCVYKFTALTQDSFFPFFPHEHLQKEQGT